MKKALMLGAMLGALTASNPALAVDEAAMMQQLKTMQEQMDKMQRQMLSMQKELAEAKAEAATAKKTASEAKVAKPGGSEPKGGDVKVSLSPGPKFETADGEYSFKIGGRAQFDAGMFNNDAVDHPNGTTLRRGRLGVSGKITKDFNYKFENDFANNASAITDAYIEYTGWDPVSITIGQFKEPFSLEELTSSLHTTFIERASTTIFAPSRKIGIGLGTYGDSSIGAWTANAGFFGDGTGVASADDEAIDTTARLTLAPIAEKNKVLHFGIAGSHRVPDSATDTMRYSARPEVALTTLRAVDTGAIAGVEHVNQFGLEAAGVWGPAALQGEYVRADVNRMAGLGDPSFDGYYVEASYFLTGESKNYNKKSAKFDRVKPLWPLDISQGHWGAWQVAARYSNLDLNDGPITGGEMRNLTLGLRWLPHAHVAILANYIRIDTDANAVTPNDSPQAWVLRTQFDF